MTTITAIPANGEAFPPPNEEIVDPYWTQTDKCAGFEVPDDCAWRIEEMQLVTFTPEVCKNGGLPGCEYLVAYARVEVYKSSKESAMWQISTTVFTICVLTCAFMIFSHDTKVIVIIPIKKVVNIILKLAENPLKKPTEPVHREESGAQMRTAMLEQTIFKIGTLL